MSLAKSYAVSLLGLAGTIIEIEAEISSNLPSFVLVGLPDASLSEAKDRVRAAAHNSGLPLPGRRVTVNLSPASVPKRGSTFDLAIALGIMAADGRVRPDSVASWIHLGELGLDGALRGVVGVLPAVLAAKRAGWLQVIVPSVNLAEACLVEGVSVLGADTLAQVAHFHGAENQASPLSKLEVLSSAPAVRASQDLDLADVIGQDDAVEALTLAAAGGHHMLMVGPPGAGKTMLAERLPSILPNLAVDEAIETTALHSISGSKVHEVSGALITRPPYEAPHHTASLISLVGGGMGIPKPGLISLANHGVLFLDEAPEFQRPVLEALRQPLESGEVLINRSAGIARFPAKFQLLMAANPCPCGNFAGKGRACVCAPAARLAYMGKLSGPLLDRIDIRLKLQPANSAQIALARLGAIQIGRTSSEIREQVRVARELARKRLSGTPWSINAQVPGSYLRRQLKTKPGVTAVLDQAVDRGQISMRGYDRCLRLAWSSADLAGRPQIEAQDIAKAVLLRGGDGVTSW
jgi:magnesium chelatase family protein